MRILNVSKILDPNGCLGALIPIDNSNTQAYSVEARKLVGFDKNEIPSSGILIHRINITALVDLNDRIAKVVDKTIDFNPNDAGAIWTPGETFQDTQNNISVKVLKETKDGFWVAINPTHRFYSTEDA